MGKNIAENRALAVEFSAELLRSEILVATLELEAATLETRMLDHLMPQLHAKIGEKIAYLEQLGETTARQLPPRFAGFGGEIGALSVQLQGAYGDRADV
jgi:hypothetical protein